MRVFRRTRGTNASAASRTASAALRESPELVEDDDCAAVACPVSGAIAAPDVVEGKAGGGAEGESDVFVCRSSRPSAPPSSRKSETDAAAAQSVTLFVYGWDNVEPGPLSWAFPSLRMALDAVRTMRNAVQWCIVAGGEWASMDAARAKGAVLIEQIG